MRLDGARFAVLAPCLASRRLVNVGFCTPASGISVRFGVNFQLPDAYEA